MTNAIAQINSTQSVSAVQERNGMDAKHRCGGVGEPLCAFRSVRFSNNLKLPSWRDRRRKNTRCVAIALQEGYKLIGLQPRARSTKQEKDLASLFPSLSLCASSSNQATSYLSQHCRLLRLSAVERSWTWVGCGGLRQRKKCPAGSTESQPGPENRSQNTFLLMSFVSLNLVPFGCGRVG